MQQLLQKFWSQTFLPMLSRPRRLQVAALCFRRTDTGCEVLLVTSRDTGRWVIPKGWPMEGKSSAESAAQEAWEEAGVHQGQFDEAGLADGRGQCIGVALLEGGDVGAQGAARAGSAGFGGHSHSEISR